MLFIQNLKDNLIILNSVHENELQAPDQTDGQIANQNQLTRHSIQPVTM